MRVVTILAGLLLLTLAIPAPTQPTIPATIATFLDSLGLHQLLDIFTREEITVDLLPLLTSSTLQVIGVPTLGQRLRIIQAAQDIRTDGAQDNDERINIEEGNQIPLVNEVQNVNENEILNPNPNQEVEEYERGSEQPEYYCEVSIKGDKKFFKYKVGNDRFNRKYTKASGIACFKCHKSGCSSTIYARYPNFETWEEDEPEITFGPTRHSINGIEHPPEVGKRQTELAKRKIMNNLLNPELLFKPVNQIHEDVVNDIVSSLNNRNEREEFLTEMSKFENLKRGEYKVRNRVLPPSPATCRDIDLNTRFVI